jgi:hypothetical protein
MGQLKPEIILLLWLLRLTIQACIGKKNFHIQACIVNKGMVRLVVGRWPFHR